jgi:hypothetical protein
MTPQPSTGLPSDTAATLFSFTPSGATSPTASSVLILGTSSEDTDPSVPCLNANHITLGAVLSCTHQEPTSGGCGPSFTITSFNPSAPGCP